MIFPFLFLQSCVDYKEVFFWDSTCLVNSKQDEATLAGDHLEGDFATEMRSGWKSLEVLSCKSR